MLPTKEFTVTIRRNGWKPLVLECGSTGPMLRGTCVIEEGGKDFKSAAEITVYGVNATHLKNYSSLALHRGKTVQRPEIVTVSVGNQVVFYGDTWLSFADFSRFPDVAFRISAVFGYSAALMQGENFYTRAEDRVKFSDAASRLVSELNSDLGLTNQKSRLAAKFSPSVKNLICPDLTLTGTSIQKINTLASALNLEPTVDRTGVYFWIPDKEYPAEFLKKKPVVSTETGLKGYPIFYNEGINFTTANIGIWRYGNFVRIKSTVPYADGEYFIIQHKSELSTLPGGKWETAYSAVYAYRKE